MVVTAHKEEQEVEIRGDVLETVLSHVPIVDLVAASHVSKWWSDSVTSSLRHHNPPKPWLILHTQSTRFPYATSAHAYDPRSNIWIKISKPSITHTAALRSAHSNFLYMLSPSEFSFSMDPLSSDWCTVGPPRVWRTDPIVTRVGDSVVVAGGACDFEDDPLAVEIYNLKTRAWRTCESMPGNLKGSASSSWLSAARTADKLIVADKQSGVIHWFDPETRSWSEPATLDPGQPVTSYHIGWSDNNSLLLIGACKIEDADTVKIWRFGEKDVSVMEEIGEMPVEFVSKLKSECVENLSVDIRVAGNIVYVYSTWAAAEVVACEVMRGGACRWWSVGNVVARDEMISKRSVFSCSEVGIEDLQRAMVSKGCRFEVLDV
ncbi:F-box/kelch-repeat protein at1g23390 [Phtheirospermum japonicum]|uniref:F-box/kelch-repeat protein at1g23390 n=1 Tax=Phtheirospermum japonicum TaxID=374723 RepID=A0A830CCY1_9LAMI|nr:F-box/kelch-repeat protein at1g23390 [Phtheirospermum japonicum]